MLWYLDQSKKLVKDFKNAMHPSERQAIDLTQLIGRQHFDEITLGQDDMMICRWLQMAMKNDNGFQSRKQFADYIKRNSKLVYINQMLSHQLDCKSVQEFEDMIAPVQAQFNLDNFKQFIDMNPERRNIRNPPMQIQQLAQDMLLALKRHSCK